MTDRFFASDNAASVHPKIMQALMDANTGHAAPYGDDDSTAAARQAFDRLFEREVDTFFVFNGTGANNAALCALTRSYGAILCAETAHIYCDEVGAPEKLTGAQLQVVKTADGKVTKEHFAHLLHIKGVQHHSQPSVVYISQCTEYGTVYTPKEVRALADWAHDNGMYLLMDGARIANAVASLGCTFAEITWKAGVDALAFGGTKNGLMFGEAVVLFDKTLSRDFPFIRKQNTQLASKMRYISAQYIALLQDDLWLTNAHTANAMAQRLEKGLRAINGIKLIMPVEANELFFKMPREAIAPLQAICRFGTWDESASIVRMVASFDTTQEDVDNFIAAAREILSAK